MVYVALRHMGTGCAVQQLSDFLEYMIVACVGTVIAAASLFSLLSGPAFHEAYSQSWTDFYIVFDVLVATYVSVLFRKIPTNWKEQQSSFFWFGPLSRLLGICRNPVTGAEFRTSATFQQHSRALSR